MLTAYYVIDRRGDVPDLTADPTLAEKELGFTAPQDLETMCRDLWNWQTKNPWGYGEPEGELMPRTRHVADKVARETNGVPIKS